MRRWIATTACCALASTAGAQTGGGSLVTTVVEQETHSPLGYSTVTVTSVDRPDSMSVSRFTDDGGQTLFAPLPFGRYHVRARELGFAPADTVVTITDSASRVVAVLQLRDIRQQLATVRVNSAATCRDPGAASDSASAAIVAQIRENANRAQLLTAAYPFYYQREERFIESKQLVRVDTGTFDSRRNPRYRAGHLVRAVRDRHGERSLVFTLPTLPDLADTAFQHRHCFWYAGLDSGAIRIDVAPVVTLGTPDVAAAFYLDSDRYLVRRAVFHLTHPERINPGLEAQTVETRYRELSPMVAIPDSIVSTMVIAQPLGSTPHSVIEQDRLIAVWDRSGLDADTASAEAAEVDTTDAPTHDVRGRLIGAHDEPLAGARLEIVGLPIMAITGDSGQFELPAVPSGAHTLFIRRIGNRPTIVMLPEVVTRSSHAVTVRLPATSVVTLDPVVIQRERADAAYHRIGFDERRRTSRGYFLDATQIARMGASQLHELAARAPGFLYVRPTHVVDNGLGPVIPDPSLRVEGDPSCLNSPSADRDHHVGDDPTCTVCVDYIADGQLVVDGTSVNPSFTFREIEAHFPPKDIAALEVYAPSAAPPSIIAQGSAACAAIVI